VIRPGEIQHMSAGTGVTHSEYNPSSTELLHLLQIWIMPEVKGIRPSYDQKSTGLSQHPGQLRLIASRDEYDAPVRINQDTNLFAGNVNRERRYSTNSSPIDMPGFRSLEEAFS